MFSGVVFEPRLSRDRPGDFLFGNDPFFDQAMGEHRPRSPVKEIQDSIVDTLQPDSKFVDSVVE